MRKMRVCAWFLAIVLLMQNMSLLAWASEEEQVYSGGEAASQTQEVWIPHSMEESSMILYSEEAVQVTAASEPSEIIKDGTDLTDGKYLKLSVILDGKEAETQIFQYDQNPGIIEVNVQEGFETESIKLDNKDFMSGSEIAFFESEQNQMRHLEIVLYTKEISSIYNEDSQGTSTEEDSSIESKPEDTGISERSSMILYSEEAVQVTAAFEPSEIIKDGTDLTDGKYLKLSVILDGKEAETQIFQYDQNPGIVEVNVQEGFETESIKLDNKDFVSGSEIAFFEGEQNQMRYLELVLYTKERSSIHNEDSQGASTQADSSIESKPENTGISESSDSITAYYEDGYGMNIEGKEIHFVTQTPPVEGGTLTVKLPAFFELTSIPASQDEYRVTWKREEIDEADEELGALLGGMSRDVITFQYKQVTSLVNISFEMKQKMTQEEIAKLSQVMVDAGEHPDQIPLNIDVFLYDSEKQLIDQDCIEGTSKLSNENTLTFTDGGGDQYVKAKSVKFFDKDLNKIYLDDSKPSRGVTEMSVAGFHYPYTDVELLVPFDKNKKLAGFADGYPYNDINKWGKIDIETYEGSEYFVGKLNNKDADHIDYDTQGEVFQQYTMNGREEVKYLRLIFEDNVEPGETIHFEKPVLLRYTYKGKTEVKELYTIGDYVFKESCLPSTYWIDLYDRIFREDKINSLCGGKLKLNYYVYNSYVDQLPIERDNVTFIVEYPYEVQPQNILALQCEEQKNFDIEYTVVDGIGTRRIVEEKGISAGYEFKLEKNEYVSKIKIKIPKMMKKAEFYFQTEDQTQTKDKDGNDIINNKTVTVEASVEMDGEKTSTVEWSITLRALKDQLYVKAKYDYNAVLDEDKDKLCHVGSIGLRSDDRYTKDYEDVVFNLIAPPEVMSKVRGYYVGLNKNRMDVIEGDLLVKYDTNKQKGKSVIVKEEDVGLDNRIYLELEDGEYVTSLNVQIEKIVGQRTYDSASSGSTLNLAPIINLTRTYYDAQGTEKEVLFDKEYSISYKVDTSTPPISQLDGMSTYVQYDSSTDYLIEEASSKGYYIKDKNGANISSEYRGARLTVEFTPNRFSQVNGGHRINRQYNKDDTNIPLDPQYYLKDQLIYFEVRQGFEISKLKVPSKLVKKEKLENGNTLFVFQCTSAISKPETIKAELYIRPDAKTESCNPIVGAGISYEKYITEHFPDYDIAQKQYPYQTVKVDFQDQNKFPDNWNLSDREKVYGLYWSFTKPSGSESLTVRNVTTSTTQMIGKLNNLLKGEEVTFKEAQRNDLGFSAFISAVSNETLNHYTATFIIPKKDDKVQGNNRTYRAIYTLYANGPMEILLNGESVDLEQNGITISYYDDANQEIQENDHTDWNKVRQIKVEFESLNNATVYEASMPLYTDERKGNTNSWNSYIGTYNQTGESAPAYNDPITYVYDSYAISSTFGLDKTEQGTSAQPLPTAHTIAVYDENWNPVFQKEIQAEGASSVNERFNAEGKELKYVGFSLEKGTQDNYLATLKRSISDITGNEGAVKTMEDGTKIWYVPVDMDDFITDNTKGLYDALFIRKPEISAEDIVVAVGKKEALNFSVSQPVNEDIVQNYKISVQLKDTEQNTIAELLQEGQQYYANGLAKGSVPYVVTVTNTQGMEFTEQATITVGNMYALLPHVGGFGAKTIAFAGAVLIAGGILVFRRNKKRNSY